MPTRRLPRRPIFRRRHRLRLLRRQRQQIPRLQNLRRRQDLAHAIFRPAPRLLPRRPRLPLRKNLLRHQRSHRRQIPHPPHRRRRTLDRTPASLRALRAPHRGPLRRQQHFARSSAAPTKPTSSSPPAAPPPASSTPPTTPKLGPSSQRPVLSGNPSAGIFSIACNGRTVVAVGGDYRNPTATKSVAAYSNDLGATWHLADQPPAGYRSAVTSVDAKNLDRRRHQRRRHLHRHGVLWTPLNHDNANAILTLDQKRVLTAGPKGTITQLTLP